MPQRTDTAAARQVLASRLARQAGWCETLGSGFYADLLRRAAADLESEGAVWNVLVPFAAEPGTSALALRLMGAVHRLVLTGELPELAAHYPSTGGDGDAAAAWPLFRDALDARADRLRELTARGCQTNEVSRSAALLGGFLEVARRTGLPLRLLEIGSSAGLNLRWDRYRYEHGSRAWGDSRSPVRMTGNFEAAPPLVGEVQVAERLGCDLAPVDPTDADGALSLRSFVWADQLDRLAMLDGALEVAAAQPASVERMDAAEFLERELAEPRPGRATVVFHSVFIQYVSEEGRERIRRAIEGAGPRTSSHAPLAWLSMEPGQSDFEVRLRLWPGGEDELLALTGPHGSRVRWLGRAQ